MGIDNIGSSPNLTELPIKELASHVMLFLKSTSKITDKEEKDKIINSNLVLINKYIELLSKNKNPENKIIPYLLKELKGLVERAGIPQNSQKKDTVPAGINDTIWNKFNDNEKTVIRALFKPGITYPQKKVNDLLKMISEITDQKQRAQIISFLKEISTPAGDQKPKLTTSQFFDFLGKCDTEAFNSFCMFITNNSAQDTIKLIDTFHREFNKVDSEQYSSILQDFIKLAPEHKFNLVIFAKIKSLQLKKAAEDIKKEYPHASFQRRNQLIRDAYKLAQEARLLGNLVTNPEFTEYFNTESAKKSLQEITENLTGTRISLMAVAKKATKDNIKGAHELVDAIKQFDVVLAQLKGVTVEQLDKMLTAQDIQPGDDLSINPTSSATIDIPSNAMDSLELIRNIYTKQLQNIKVMQDYKEAASLNEKIVESSKEYQKILDKIQNGNKQPSKKEMIQLNKDIVKLASLNRMMGEKLTEMLRSLPPSDTKNIQQIKTAIILLKVNTATLKQMNDLVTTSIKLTGASTKNDIAKLEEEQKDQRERLVSMFSIINSALLIAGDEMLMAIVGLWKKWTESKVETDADAKKVTEKPEAKRVTERNNAAERPRSIGTATDTDELKKDLLAYVEKILDKLLEKADPETIAEFFKDELPGFIKRYLQKMVLTKNGKIENIVQKALQGTNPTAFNAFLFNLIEDMPDVFITVYNELKQRVEDIFKNGTKDQIEKVRTLAKSITILDRIVRSLDNQKETAIDVPTILDSSRKA